VGGGGGSGELQKTSNRGVGKQGTRKTEDFPCPKKFPGQKLGKSTDALTGGRVNGTIHRITVPKNSEVFEKKGNIITKRAGVKKLGEKVREKGGGDFLVRREESGGPKMKDSKVANWDCPSYVKRKMRERF